ANGFGRLDEIERVAERLADVPWRGAIELDAIAFGIGEIDAPGVAVVARIELVDAFLDEPRIIRPQVLQAGNAERDRVDGRVCGVLGPPRGNGDLMMLDRIAAQE